MADVLQQYLPFTVLKRKYRVVPYIRSWHVLQQYLPFTVLKLIANNSHMAISTVATVLTVYGIETCRDLIQVSFIDILIVATVLTVYGIETL